MTTGALAAASELARRLAEAESTILALVSGQIDAVVDPESHTPLLLAKAQDALRDSEERYRQIVEATSDGIIKLDERSSIVFVNRRLAEMLGYAPEEMIGRSLFSFMSEAARMVAERAFQGARQLTNNDAFDGTFRHRDGSEVAVNVAPTVLADKQGRYAGSLGVVRDVTVRKKLESQLMVSDRMASVGTLAGGVAHEINNPLAVVIANLEYVVERLTRAEGKDAAWFSEEITPALGDARDAAERVRLIVHDLKIFSRVADDALVGPVDVKAIMRSSIRMAWNEIRHRAALIEDYQEIPPIEVDEGRLGQVLLNLIVNAAQAVPEGRAEQNEIRVSIRPEGSQVVIEVKDTGGGIAPDVIGRVFDAFFTTKAIGTGTGLGLAISHRIVTDMAGELTVESELGRGTTFRVALPVTRKVRTEVAALPEPIPGVVPPRRRARILVVDDEPLIIRGIQRVLAKEHDVVTCVAAKDALALIGSGEVFDVILCDLMMPVMTGMDLHHELSRVAPAQASKMVFMTGGAFTASASRFLSETHREHVEKPFDHAALRRLVQRRVG